MYWLYFKPMYAKDTRERYAAAGTCQHGMPSKGVNAGSEATDETKLLIFEHDNSLYDNTEHNSFG